MPYADPARRRAFDAARKRRQRAQGWTKKRVDMRPTQAEIETSEDLRGLFNEVVTDLRHADDLKLEAKLRIKLRAVEIGLRVIETANHEQRIAALEEQSK